MSDRNICIMFKCAIIGKCASKRCIENRGLCTFLRGVEIE